ncbi:MAG: hypothetical protein LBU16_07030 [Treponema sp.]|jgi:hypothetical protein|nr:hypothetical protein [Treponema sp.]
MPVIKESADLRNNYSEISALENGEGCLAVMSTETYEIISGKNELYKLIQEGIDDIKTGKH